MREIFEDAENFATHDPVMLAKSAARPKLARRFYKKVDAHKTDDGCQILLDGKAVKTPGHRVLLLPGETSAGIVVAEWQNQKTDINPLDMPVTRIMNTVIDGVALDGQAVFEDILRFAGADLICYRAHTPNGLVKLQQMHWDPVLDWLQSELGAQFSIASGIVHVTQPKQAISALAARLKLHSDPVDLACVHNFTSLTGSALLACALAVKFLDTEQTWAAAHVDEDWNIKLSGEDGQARLHREQRWREMSAAHALLLAVRQDRAAK